MDRLLLRGIVHVLVFRWCSKYGDARLAKAFKPLF